MNCIVQNLWHVRALSVLAAQAAAGLASIISIYRPYRTTNFDQIRLGLKPIQTFDVDEDFFNDFREESKKVERSAEDKEDS